MKTIACEHNPNWRKFHDKRFGAVTVMPNDSDEDKQNRKDRRNNGVCGACFTVRSASGECNC
jgi:hypothetical protein